MLPVSFINLYCNILFPTFCLQILLPQLLAMAAQLWHRQKSQALDSQLQVAEPGWHRTIFVECFVTLLWPTKYQGQQNGERSASTAPAASVPTAETPSAARILAAPQSQRDGKLRSCQCRCYINGNSSAAANSQGANTASTASGDLDCYGFYPHRFNGCFRNIMCETLDL